MKIRRMTEEDCKKAAGLEKAIFSQPWSERGFLDALARKENIFLAAEEAGELCGYLGMYQSLDEGEITNVAVLPKVRNLGVATKLINTLIDFCQNENISKIMLEVRYSNEKAISLYEKCGFYKVGTRKNYYKNPCEDAILMDKNINPKG